MIRSSIIFFILLISFWANAQKQSTSPYSQFGTGEETSQTNVFSSNIGGAEGALSGPVYLNFTNPATLSELKFTLFDIGGYGSQINSKDIHTSQKSNLAGLSYLSMGFPIGKKMGVMMGLMPASNTDYQIKTEQTDETGELSELEVFTGGGSTNRLTLAAGYRIYRGLSLGLEGNYYFGNIENSIIHSTRDVYYSTHYKNLSYLSGYSAKAALYYKYPLTNERFISAGLTAKLPDKLQGDTQRYLYTARIIGNIETPNDTLINEQNIKGEVERPLKFGIHLGAGKKEVWYAGMSLEKQNAWIFDSSIVPHNTKVRYTDKFSLGAGGYWIPKYNSLTSYWKRVTYSMGAKYEKTGLELDPTGNAQDFTSINKFGISFGMGLPVGNRLSQINLGLEYGAKGINDKGLIQENYFNLRLGIKISEKWFIKSKID